MRGAQCRVATDGVGDPDRRGDNDGGVTATTAVTRTARVTARTAKTDSTLVDHKNDTGGGSGGGSGGVFDGAPIGSLVKVTSAGANGAWWPRPDDQCHDHLEPEGLRGIPRADGDCVKIGSKISKTLSQEHEPGRSGGTDHFSYVVPLDGTGADQICDRATILGPWLNTEKSAILCYTAMGVQTPEVPNTLMLPVAAVLIFAGGLWIARRRRRHRLRS